MTSNNTYRMSVVIVVHDQSESIENNLPAFLTMAQAVNCEVIVVENTSTDNTPDVLKRMKADYDNLYTTYLPQPVRIISQLQLAFTIGAKAAHSNRIVLANIDRPPVCNEWLELLDCEGEAALVYTINKGNDVKVCHKSYTTLEDARPFICKAERRSGRGHQGRRHKLLSGLYDAVAVSKDRVYEAIKYFDHNIKGHHLMALQIQVCWKNLCSRGG